MHQKFKYNKVFRYTNINSKPLPKRSKGKIMKELMLTNFLKENEEVYLALKVLIDIDDVLTDEQRDKLSGSSHYQASLNYVFNEIDPLDTFISWDILKMNLRDISSLSENEYDRAVEIFQEKYTAESLKEIEGILTKEEE